MLRKILLLTFASLLGMLVASLLGLVAGPFLDLIPADWSRTAEYASLIAGVLGEGARYLVAGFIFWSGSRASVKEAALWAVLGGTALEPTFAAVMAFDLRAYVAFGLAMASLAQTHPVFFAAAFLARAAGGLFGAKLGDDYETDLRVHTFQEVVFRLYPFQLPR